MDKSGRKRRVKRSFLSVAFIILFLGFIGIIDYPYLIRLYNEQIQGDVVMSQEQAVERAGDQRIREELEKAEEYNAALASSGVSLADAFRTQEEADKGYASMLNLQGDGVMGMIEIPKLSLTLPIYHGTSEETLQKGAGHLQGSSLPVGGTGTHTCISAHRGLPDKELFTNLDQMEKGDIFFLKVMGETLCYRIFQIETVEPDDTDSLSVVQGKDRATLITCTPYGLNTHRLYLHGERIPWNGEFGESGDQSMGIRQFLVKYWWTVATTALLLWMGYLLYRLNRK